MVVVAPTELVMTALAQANSPEGVAASVERASTSKALEKEKLRKRLQPLQQQSEEKMASAEMEEAMERG